MLQPESGKGQIGGSYMLIQKKGNQLIAVHRTAVMVPQTHRDVSDGVTVSYSSPREQFQLLSPGEVLPPVCTLLCDRRKEESTGRWVGGFEVSRKGDVLSAETWTELFPVLRDGEYRVARKGGLKKVSRVRPHGRHGKVRAPALAKN